MLFPVCAPSLLASGPPLKRPADLAQHRLLHVLWCSAGGTPFRGWREWLDAAGATQVAAPPTQQFSLFGLALAQAAAGRGVSLANRVLAGDRLASGAVVRPFGGRYLLQTPFTYALLMPATGAPSPPVRMFEDWLVARAAQFDAAAD